jgi:hypothetical protein
MQACAARVPGASATVPRTPSSDEEDARLFEGASIRRVFPLAKLFALPPNVWYPSILIRENMLAEPFAAGCSARNASE